MNPDEDRVAPCDLMHLMGGDATVGDSGRPESMSRSATMLWRACMAVFVVVTAASWVTAVWLSRLPRTDDSGRSVLYFYWNHTSNFWFGVVLAAAAALSPVLAAGLLVQIVRHVHGGWRVLTMVVGWGGWLCGTAYLAVLAFLIVMLGGLEGSQTIVRGSDGSRVMITLAYDGDVGGVWRPATSFTYLQEPGAATVDPWSGPCRLDRVMESQLMLTCGSTSQLMSADLRRPDPRHLWKSRPLVAANMT